jgi:hypothetical protein
MKRGRPVTVRLTDGTQVKGQVWEEASEDSDWVALDNGQFVRVAGNDAFAVEGRKRVGRVVTP